MNIDNTRHRDESLTELMVTTSVRIPVRMMVQLKALKSAEGRTMTRVITDLLGEAIEQRNICDE